MADSKTPLLPPPPSTPDTKNAITTPNKSSDVEAAPAPADTMASRRTSKSRFQIALVVFLVSIFWLARTWNCDHEHNETETKVPLDVHIMSKCPDARACLKKLVLPTMAEVSDKVDFRLSFIGTINPSDDGVACKHGQTECRGNIMLLCAASEYPDPKLSLGFANCMINDYHEIPSQALAEDCALEHGLDFGVLNDCMSRDTGAYGMKLLHDSVKHSTDVGVATSCTVRLDDKVRCVYDDGQWVDCPEGEKPGDLIRDIESLYDEKRGWSYA